MSPYPLVDQYLGMSLDIELSDLRPGAVQVVETPRRHKPEQSYGFIHALYGIFFADGRTAISVTPGARTEVIEWLDHEPWMGAGAAEQAWLETVKDIISRCRMASGLPPAQKAYESLLFACNGSSCRSHLHGDCRRLSDARIPAVEGLTLPTHCFPDGIVYGIAEDERVVSVAYAHRSGKMEDRIADLGVETAAPYRHRGYAQTVMSAVTAHLTSRGGEAVYMCSLSNQASIATAMSVGYQRYGSILTVSAPAPDDV